MRHRQSGEASTIPESPKAPLGASTSGIVVDDVLRGAFLFADDIDCVANGRDDEEWRTAGYSLRCIDDGGIGNSKEDRSNENAPAL